MGKILLLLSVLVGTESWAAISGLRQIEVQNQTLVVEQVFKATESVWGIDFENDQFVYITLVNGQIKKIDTSTGSAVETWNGPVSVRSGQGGLLDIKLHPQFSTNKTIYVSYAKAVLGKATTAVAKAKLLPGQQPTWSDIFVAQPALASGVHFGSRLAFDDAGYLFISVGERGDRNNAQNLQNHLGKILRVKDDGTVPSDNPFLSTAGAMPEIWSYGHRNPQGLFFDQSTKALYEMEHGPQGGDEINVIAKGANYGWPVITYGKEYGSGAPIGPTHKAGMEQPIKYYIPSIAPSGLMVYSGKTIPEWKNFFFSGALALQHLNILEINGQTPGCERRALSSFSDRFRSVAESPAGFIYFGTDSGKLLRIRPGRGQGTGVQAVCKNYPENPPQSVPDEEAAPVVAVPLRPTYSDIHALLIKPYCLSCHGAGMGAKPELSDYAKVLSGVNPGSSSSSVIMRALDSGRMPPSVDLRTTAPELIEMLRRWIDQGAVQ